MNRVSVLTASIIFGVGVSGCGGGGGGGGAPVATVLPVVVVPVVAASIVTSVPSPTYNVATEELAAFNLLNAERSRCGFGMLAQNAALDSAAKAHADWSLINNQYGHFQSSTIPNRFTGVSPQDRATAAGYASLSVTETLVGAVGQPSIAGLGIASARGLMAAPYHLFGMMSPYKDLGISVRSVNSVTPLVANGLSNIAVYDFGVATGADYQTADANTVSTYPCNGVTGVKPSVKGEFPNPVPGRDLAANPLGQTMLVMVRKGQTLVISSASLTNNSTGSPVALRAPVTASNDPNNLLSGYGNYMGYVVPDAALAVNTSYQASITGTNNGAAFSRTFTFTTGSDF
jgi:uncharacterized protein YkwD